MKKLLKTAAVALFALTTLVAQAKPASKPVVDRIEPPYWWTGMKNDTLQLMVYGPGIASADASVNYPGVKLLDVVRPDSPDYLFLYLSVGDEARPGSMPVTFTSDKKSLTVDYSLRPRTGLKPGFEGFDASDVLYLVMPDRFADGDPSNNELPDIMKRQAHVDRTGNHARHGGDIQGIIDHLDYIDSLGVTAVWVNPVLENDVRGGSYHGYATTDFYRIDPRFGSNDLWREMIAEANDRGLKVVMDMIFNHSAADHPWLANPPFADWYNFPDPDNFVQTNYRLSTLHDPYASDYDLTRTTDGWFVRGMPDLNQRNPHLMKYLIQNSIWWIEDSKISGIRMDTYPYADLRGMASWIDAVELEYPDFNIVGECWYTNEGGEAFWQRGSRVNPVDPRLETVMDFRLMLDGPDAFSEPTADNNGLHKIYEHLALDYLFPDPQKILTFLDNHDTDRFLRSMPDNLDSWKQAQTFLLTSRGIPQIYYGTEQLMNGTRREGGDGNIRRDMPGGFPGDSISVFTPDGRTPLQAEAFDFLSRLLNWRRGAANEVIARGSLKHFIPTQGLYVYERRLGDKQVIVMMNGTDDTLTADMTPFAEILPTGTTMPDFITGQQITVEPRMTFSPRQILILNNL